MEVPKQGNRINKTAQRQRGEASRRLEQYNRFIMDDETAPTGTAAKKKKKDVMK